MREDDARSVRSGNAVAVPSIDHHIASLVPRRGGMHRIMLVIGIDRLTRPPGCAMPLGLLTPVVALAANLVLLDAALPFVNSPACSIRLALLVLSWIPRHPALCTALLRF